MSQKPPPKQFVKTPINGTRFVLLVSSAKGGVGKSTIAVNLAFALQNQGLKIGILDADVYGPSLPKLLNLKEKPKSEDGKAMIPLKKYNAQCMSMGFLVDEQTPMIWRGPVSVLKWSEDNLQCYSEAELLRDGMKKYCKDRADSFEQSLKLRRYRKFSDFSLPVAFTGKVRNYSLAHRIVLTADGNNSYAIYYNNEIQLPMVAECQMIDAKEQKFWYQLF